MEDKIVLKLTHQKEGKCSVRVITLGDKVLCEFDEEEKCIDFSPLLDYIDHEAMLIYYDKTLDGEITDTVKDVAIDKLEYVDNDTYKGYIVYFKDVR